MGSQSSKFGPESMVGTKRDQMITINSSNSKPEIETRIKKSENDTTVKETNLINTSFKWTYGGNSVFVTGTFTGWKDHVPLQKVGNEFNTILRLPKGVYYYKYIVDGEWKFSPDDLTAPDEHGNINNIIDTTTVETVNKIIGADDERKSTMTISTKTTKAENPFTEEAPQLPAHLLEVYFLNERDKKLKDQNELLDKFGNMELEDIGTSQKVQVNQDPRKEFIENKGELAPPTHVTLNHLASYGPLRAVKNYTVTSMTQRFRSKYATVQFYSSKFSQVH